MLKPGRPSSSSSSSAPAASSPSRAAPPEIDPMILTSPPANTNAAPAAMLLIEHLRRTHPAAQGPRAVPSPSALDAPSSSCRKYSGGVARRAAGAEPPDPQGLARSFFQVPLALPMASSPTITRASMKNKPLVSWVIFG